MTRRLTGSSSTSRSRSPNVLRIGHLSNKSTVCSPISMSHMSQDLVQNHMKSHYQRITSAKACVDTSAPKCLKLTIKERDRKRREALQHSTWTTPRSSAKQTNSQGNSMKAQDEGQDASVTDPMLGPGYYNESIFNDSVIKSKSTRNGIIPSVHSSTSKYERRVINMEESTRKDRNLCKDFSNDSRDHNGYTKYERTSKSEDFALVNDPHWTNNTNHSEINNLDETQINRQYTSTPRLEQSHLVEYSPLQMSNISFSYKEPPSTMRKTKKRPEEIIWTEEQKYLNFISEVTNDVLARGIFSNRVLNRVFESHVEKRKEELDEEHMMQLIDQLKDDLGITDC